MTVGEVKEQYPLLWDRVKEATNSTSTNPFARAMREGTTPDSTLFKNIVMHCLTWTHLYESDIFWQYLYYNRYEEAKLLYPHLFEYTPNGKVIKNGFFKVKR